MAIRIHPSLKKIVGAILLAAGIFALLTPLTPGSGLIFVGLEFLGIRILFIENMKERLRRRRRGVRDPAATETLAGKEAEKPPHENGEKEKEPGKKAQKKQ